MTVASIFNRLWSLAGHLAYEAALMFSPPIDIAGNLGKIICSTRKGKIAILKLREFLFLSATLSIILFAWLIIFCITYYFYFHFFSTIRSYMKRKMVPLIYNPKSRVNFIFFWIFSIFQFMINVTNTIRFTRYFFKVYTRDKSWWTAGVE